MVGNPLCPARCRAERASCLPTPRRRGSRSNCPFFDQVATCRDAPPGWQQEAIRCLSLSLSLSFSLSFHLATFSDVRLSGKDLYAWVFQASLTFAGLVSPTVGGPRSLRQRLASSPVQASFGAALSASPRAFGQPRHSSILLESWQGLPHRKAACA